MQNEKPRYCLNEHSERLAYLIQEQLQLISSLEEAIKVQDSAFWNVNRGFVDLFLDMIGVEKESEEFCREDIVKSIFDFYAGEITLDEFMRLANGSK